MSSEVQCDQFPECCGDPREGALLDNPREFQFAPYLELRVPSPRMCWNQHIHIFISICVLFAYLILGMHHAS